MSYLYFHVHTLLHHPVIAIPLSGKSDLARALFEGKQRYAVAPGTPTT
jgi:hypothetical protein